MKKIFPLLIVKICLFVLVFFTFSTPFAKADEAISYTTNEKVYDFSYFSPETLLNLFYNALQEGRDYPTETEFEAAGILPSDIEFVRSHVRKAEILPRTDRVVTDTYEERNLWCNLPTDIGDTEAGYPDGDFNSDAFSMWNYTHLFGSWNHTFFQVPGAWVDAAHRNGTDILSGLKYFASWDNNRRDSVWVNFCTQKNADGTFKYVRPLINCLLFFGSDGINFNWEDEQYANDDVVAFHKALYKEAEAQGKTNFHIGLYTPNDFLNSSNINALYGNQEGRTADTFLNYGGGEGDFTHYGGYAVKIAKSITGSSDGIYAGVYLLSMNQTWMRIDEDDNYHRAGICIWGEHDQSRFMSYNEGRDSMDFQRNYQLLLERAFSGGNRNPIDRPEISHTGNNWQAEGDKSALSTFCGFAQFIPERSAIQGSLPFVTHFNLGNGTRYHYKGKWTMGSWYNISAQDYVPTYRWLICQANEETPTTDVSAEFTHTDSYIGGSCLLLTGTPSEKGADIILYKTKLTIQDASPTAILALKDGKEGETSTGLSLILRKEGSSKWIEIPTNTIKDKTWEEQEFALTAFTTGDVIDRIGLRLRGNGSTSQSLLIGKILIKDNQTVQPASLNKLVAEVKQETKNSLSLKLHWNVNQKAEERAANNLLYNDEANIDHFEILYKNGENGRVSEIGRTSQWATFISKIGFSSPEDQPFVGVRAASIDLKTYSPIIWVKVPRSEQSLLPDGEGNTSPTPDSIHDSGIADEPDGIQSTSSINSPLKENCSTVEAKGDFLRFSNIEKAWIYTPDGKFTTSITTQFGQSYCKLPPHSTYIVRMLYQNVIRTCKVVLK